MKAKFTSSKSVAKNQTVPIDKDDPRLSKLKRGQTLARQGAEVQQVDVSGTANLTVGSVSSTQNSGTSNVTKSPDSNTFGANYEQLVNAITNPGPNDPTGRPKVVTLGQVSNLTAAWSGGDLVFQFDFDPTLGVNATVNEFGVHVVAGVSAGSIEGRSLAGRFKLDRTKTHHTYTFSEAINRETLGAYIVDLASFCVYTVDSIGVNFGDEVCITPPSYVLDLNAPQATMVNANNGYIVTVTNTAELAKASFLDIDIWEIESSDTTEPVDTGSNYQRVYLSTINPATIISPNLNARWVKVRFSSKSGMYTSFSAAQKLTPISTTSVDLIPPNEVTQVTATWSGDDIVVNYKLPSQDPGVRIQIQLTAPNNLVGYFYRFPDSSGRNQTTTIYKKDLFDQFGEHYSSFTGILRSIDSADNRSDGVSFTVDTRANPLTGVTPDFTLTALSNAYSVNFTLPTGAVYADVYAKHTSWSGNPTDETYRVYSGLSPAVITDTNYTPVYVIIRYYDDFLNTSNYSSQKNVTTLDPGLITSFENPISFGANAVIYAGNSATSGTRTLFKAGGIFAYDAVQSSPSTQIVSNASDGTPTFITTQAQIADWKINTTAIENTLSGTPSKYTGLSGSGTYSFWAGSDVSGGNASSNFYVTPSGQVQAKNISIVGSGYKSVTATISGTTATYTAATAHGFMAGQIVKITGMTPAGYNTVSTIATVPSTTTFTITGITASGNGTGGAASTALLSSSGTFNVFNDGSVTATSADITGKITASSGSFTGNVTVGSGGSISSGTYGQSTGNAGYILNTSGLRFDYGSTQGITQLVASTGKFITKSADIGLWLVDSSTIKRTTSAGVITLDSGDTSGSYLSVYTKSSAGDYTAGIVANESATGAAIWAGNVTGPSTASSAAFYVQYDGTMNAKNASISGGTITSSGGSSSATQKITIDGTHDLIQFGTGSSSTQLFTRAVTGGKATFLSNAALLDSSYALSQTAMDASSYLAVGPIVNAFGTTMSGIGLYSTNAYINVTASNGIGMITGSSTATTGIILNNGSVSIGALDSGATTITSGSASTITMTSTTIQLTASSARVNGVGSSSGGDGSGAGASAYSGPSRITLDRTAGVIISGVQVQGDISMAKGTPNYMGASPLGAYPRQRMLVEDPASGQVKLGMAVYYSSASQFSGIPSASSGYVGDLWVEY